MSAAKNILSLYAIASTVTCAILYSQMQSAPLPSPQAKNEQCEARASAPQPGTPVNQPKILDLNISQALNQPQQKLTAPQAGLPPVDLDQVAQEGLWNNILRYVSVTPEQKKKLLALQRAYAEIENGEMTPAEQDQKMSSLPTEEEILGEELSQKLREAQNREEDVWRNENADRTLAYLEHAIGSKLGADQREKALLALRAYDEYDPSTRADAEAAYLEQKLGLSKEQFEQVRKMVGKAQADAAAKEPTLDAGAIDASQGLSSAQAGTGNESDDQALAEQLSPILTEEQRKAYQALLNQKYLHAQTFSPVTSDES